MKINQRTKVPHDLHPIHLTLHGLSAILVFVGTKMLLSNEGASLFGVSLHHELPTSVALGVVGGILALSIIASVVFPDKKKQSKTA